MKQILDYLKLKKLGTPVLPPFEKFEGLVAAKVSRRGIENFVVAKWNPDFLVPDVAFDPNTSLGNVECFLELYLNSDVSDEDLEQDGNADNDLEDEPDGNLESTNENSSVPLPIFEALKSDELSEWLIAHGISHKTTLTKAEKVKLCEKCVSDLAEQE